MANALGMNIRGRLVFLTQDSGLVSNLPMHHPFLVLGGFGSLASTTNTGMRGRCLECNVPLDADGMDISRLANEDEVDWWADRLAARGERWPS